MEERRREAFEKPNYEIIHIDAKSAYRYPVFAEEPRGISHSKFYVDALGISFYFFKLRGIVWKN